jgi:hypothetical protein
VAAGSALPLYAQANDLSAAAPFTSSDTKVAQSTLGQPGSWQPDISTGKTRAQVHRELVHAEQDGHLQYLDHTFYAHH